MRVHQIMTRKVVTVKSDTSILEAANLMLHQHNSGLPVVGDTGRLIGIVSEGDFIRRSDAEKTRSVA
jgi:CBS domain-containing protein